MATRMLMIATTVIISIKVNPAGLPAPSGLRPRTRKLPVTVLGAVQALGLAEGVDVPHVLAAPARLVGIVLVAALSPFGLARHGVDGDAAQELQLEVDAAHLVHALHQGVEVRRITLAAQPHVGAADLAGVD